MAFLCPRVFVLREEYSAPIAGHQACLTNATWRFLEYREARKSHGPNDEAFFSLAICACDCACGVGAKPLSEGAGIAGFVILPFLCSPAGGLTVDPGRLLLMPQSATFRTGRVGKAWEWSMVATGECLEKRSARGNFAAAQHNFLRGGPFGRS